VPATLAIETTEGFNWTAAGLGAAGGALVIVLLGGLVTAARRRGRSTAVAA